MYLLYLYIILYIFIHVHIFIICIHVSKINPFGAYHHLLLAPDETGYWIHPITGGGTLKTMPCPTAWFIDVY